MTTVDRIMELADAYADRYYRERNRHTEESIFDRGAARAALLAALQELTVPQEPVDSYDRGYARGMEQSALFREETRAYKEAYFNLVEQMASLEAMKPRPIYLAAPQPAKGPKP